MSIWGKIVGGAAGFALGGPLGALLGGLAGHAVDKMRDSAEEAVLAEQEGRPSGASRPEKSIAFTIGVIVLGAKMAKADGSVTRDEVAAFKEVFHVPQEEMRNVGRIFNQAKRDARGFEPYARQLGRMFRDNPKVLEELLDGLFHIARADGRVAEAELAYLEQVARHFGFDEPTWQRIRAANAGPVEDDPYVVLGLPHDADDESLRRAYRDLVREHHPDRLMSQGLPEEFVSLANEKLARINRAWTEVKKRRGIR